MKIKISVIIPVYNGEKFIREAVESVAAQTYPAHELIIINDGSTDNTEQIVEHLASESELTITCISQKNLGVSVARNVGLAKSSGKLVAFLDADDQWLPEKLALQINHLKNNDDQSLYFCDFFLDEQLETQRNFFRCNQVSTLLDSTFDREKFQVSFIKQNFVGTASVILCNREIAIKAGGFNPYLKHSEDFDFIFRYSQFADVLPVNHALVIKNKHEDNLSGNLTLYYWSHLYVLSLLLKSSLGFTRLDLKDNVLKQILNSHDEFIIKFCNQIYENKGSVAFASFLINMPRVKTIKGFYRLLYSMFRKAVRWLSFNTIKKRK